MFQKSEFFQKSENQGKNWGKLSVKKVREKVVGKGEAKQSGKISGKKTIEKKSWEKS